MTQVSYSLLFCTSSLSNLFKCIVYGQGEIPQKPEADDHHAVLHHSVAGNMTLPESSQDTLFIEIFDCFCYLPRSIIDTLFIESLNILICFVSFPSFELEQSIP